MNYTEKIFKGSALGLIMIAIGTLVGYVIRLYLSRTMSVADFGLFYGVLAFTGIFSVFFEIGLKEGLIKYIPAFRVDNDNNKVKSIVSFVLLVHILLASILIIIFVFLSDYIAVAYFHNTSAAIVLKIIGISGALFIFIRDATSIFSGLGRVKMLSYVSPFNSIAFLVFILLASVSLTGVSYAYLLSVVITIAVFYAIIFRMPFFTKGKQNTDKEMIKQLMFFSIPLFMVGFLDSLTSQMDTLVLTYFRSLEEVGYYQVALPTSRLLLVFYSAIVLVIFPIFSEMWAKKDKNGISSTMSMILKYMLIVILPFVMLAIAFPNEIIRMLFGVKYLPAAPALQILSFSVVFLTLNSVMSILFVSMGKIKLYAKIMVFVFIANLAMNIALVPSFGIIGAAVATTLSLFFAFLVYLYFVEKEVRISFKLTDFCKIVLLSLAVLASITITKTVLDLNPWVEMAISLAVSSILYLFLLVFSRTITKKDIDLLSRANVWVPDWLKNLVSKIVR
ncbi:MAG: flippase [Candidatus Aenigmarchaeota archaeon]|nr:flippase [Candidatus Aenigmarchaeota archaeon]